MHLWSAGDLASQAADLLKNAGETGGSAGKTLDTQPQNLTMLTTRNSSGGAEKHQFWSDYLIVLDGEGQELTGGSIVAPKTQENGEIRGQRLEGAASHTLHKGDILFIPAGTPHQALEAPGQHITIFVIKVAKPAPTA